MPTFPTAFWKTRPPASVGVGTNISWETGLWWSHGDGSPALQKLSNIGFLQLQLALSQFTKVQNSMNGMVLL